MVKKIKLTMSVELQVKLNNNLDKVRQDEAICMFARNYLACLGDKDIKLDNVEVMWK